jgi:hypothetical protein
MRISRSVNFRRHTRQLGQGMTEYIIIVMVMAIGSIFVYTQFGDVLRNQMAAAAKTLAGQDGRIETADAQRAANAAATGTSRNLGNAAGNSGSGDSGGGSGNGGGDGNESSGDGEAPGSGDSSGDGGGPSFGGGGGAFEPPPPGGGAPGGGGTPVKDAVEGFGGSDPLNDEVMAVLCLSDTLCKDVKKWKAQGVEFAYTTGSSRVDQKTTIKETCVITTGKETCKEEATTKITVYINNGAWNELEVVRHIAHEVGHLESKVYKPRAEDVSRDVFVQSRLEDEGAAVMYNIKVQREILAKGGEWKNIGVNCGMANQTECHTRYESIYNNYAAGKISADTARKQVAALRANESTMSGPTYREYYGKHWDDKNPSTP